MVSARIAPYERVGIKRRKRKNNGRFAAPGSNGKAEYAGARLMARNFEGERVFFKSLQDTVASTHTFAGNRLIGIIISEPKSGVTRKK